MSKRILFHVKKKFCPCLKLNKYLFILKRKNPTIYMPCLIENSLKIVKVNVTT